MSLFPPFCGDYDRHCHDRDHCNKDCRDEDHYDKGCRDKRYHHDDRDVCNGPKLMVYRRDGFEEGSISPSQNNQWRINSGDWDRPKIKKRGFHFEDGIIRVDRPGIYKVLVSTSMYIFNGSAVAVSGEAKSRVSQGRGYADKHLATTIFPAVIPPRAYPPGVEERIRPNTTLLVDVDVLITHEDIRRGYNELFIEYMFNVFLIGDEQWPEGLEIGREARNAQNYITLTKIGDACRE